MFRKESGIVGCSKTILEVIKSAKSVAESNATVLIQGESGTGKELMARYIHKLSGRKGNFVALSLAAIPENLIESELFGVLKGAFTSADASRRGFVQLANCGTLFLDEIGEISPKIQVKLLRLLQEQQFSMLGSTKTESVDLRVIAATNKDLAKEVGLGNFRADLYYRLKVFPIEMPPLRTRKEDIITLIRHFYTDRFAERELRISLAAEQALLNYSWPGNVRELKAVTDKIIISIEDDYLSFRDLPESIRLARKFFTRQDLSENVGVEPEGLGEMLAEFEKKLIAEALEFQNGNIAAAAVQLKVKRTTLYEKIKRYGLSSRL